MPIDIDAVVLSNEQLSEEYNVVKLAAPEIATQCKPGQFVMVKQNFITDSLLRRPFSIFEILRDDKDHVIGVSLLNKRVGIVTEALFALQPGNRLRCLGPIGHPFSIISRPSLAWMVAGGVGLAPFATLSEVLRKQGVSTKLFYGARSTTDLFRIDIFENLGVHVIVTTEDGSYGEAGIVTIPLEREIKALSPNTPLMIYACGPTAMMRAVNDLANLYQQPTEVSLEPVMGCGLGGCYSCVVHVKSSKNDQSGHFVRACLDGPVFSGDQLLWNALAN